MIRMMAFVACLLVVVETGEILRKQQGGQSNWPESTSCQARVSDELADVATVQTRLVDGRLFYNIHVVADETTDWNGASAYGDIVFTVSANDEQASRLRVPVVVIFSDRATVFPLGDYR